MSRKVLFFGMAILVMVGVWFLGCEKENALLEPMEESEDLSPGSGPGEAELASPSDWPRSMSDFRWPWKGVYNACAPEYWKIYEGAGYGQGYHLYGNYHAVDLVRTDGTTLGSKVLAPARGTVKYARWSDSWGWYVRMDHRNGWESLVAHLNCDPRYFVNEGNDLLQGTLIGIAGSTGWTGPERGLPAFPHVHFVIYKNGNSQALIGISGYSTIQEGITYSSGNAFVSPPLGRTSCP